jgi:hypothetical protein
MVSVHQNQEGENTTGWYCLSSPVMEQVAAAGKAASVPARDQMATARAGV